ncbi:GNAT family N-acetyltransferase [Tautonia plasticadhaerens]|uniref:N-acetyltransferase domain-containing protein n=1 Tax=Tautonia plasticadhaerens TaxID=2527974 RepID=A0A518GUJ0_9BACT|nr:N-acetyltransferase [Tautonia plasticadhaerens]QDV32246.1 hypothetical protein ElP_00690 [Tautonia plasticadhaerens]
MTGEGPVADLTIRPETPDDLDAVRLVNEAAFGQPAEADLVDALRRSSRPFLSMVAERSGTVVGHVAFSPVTINGPHPSDATPPILLGLAPVAVRPGEQGRGVGSALIRSGLEACRAIGAGAIVVLGHPTYYPRFGFEVAARLGLRCEYDVPEDAFLVVELIPGALDGRSGTVRYHEAFSAV